MSDADLLAAIQANPAALALAQLGDDRGCAALIAATLPKVVQSINQNQLITWATSRGLLVKLAAGASNSNALVASACIAVESFLSGGARFLDLTDPVIAGSSGLLYALQAGGILPANTDTTGSSPTPGSPADLLAFASVPASIDYQQISNPDVMGQFRPGGRIA